MSDLHSRAREIAAFLGIPEFDAHHRLMAGFEYQHVAINNEYRRAGITTDAAGNADPVQLLNWYRTTTGYVWELTAYHLDAGFNYYGMIGGIIEHLRAFEVRRVLSLGDGIGDLTLALQQAGFEAVYHDLAGSRTAEFARRRNIDACGEFAALLTQGWEPPEAHEEFDAVVSLDFMEHVTSVEEWCRFVFRALKPGGLFCSQNAFDCGSGPDGAIPCHLKVNDKYAHRASETDGRALWDVLLAEIGFRQISSNWYRKPI